MRKADHGARYPLLRSRLTALVAASIALALVSSGASAAPLAASEVRLPDSGGGATSVPPGICATPEGGGSPTAAAAVPDLELPEYQQVVRPSESRPRTISYDDATLVVGPGAVSLPVGIGITPLTRGRLPRMDPGMTNVTAGPRAGYRFTPHPQQFTAMIELTLPYDPALIGPEFTPQDVYTYFYDDVALCWQVLQRVSVDEESHTVTSLTDHFTDMVNATVTAPEHPEGTQFDPNQIKGIQPADPASRINAIEPPETNNQGENRLSYPIEVPPGRKGLQPRLGVSYNSSGGDGWLGLGWDLPTPAVMIDTRWGVPRYQADQETETYLLNGEQLTPLAHRGTPAARTAEKVFHTRTEAAFARIVRHGTGPASYTWEVTDKSGTRWLYGAPAGAGGPAPDATLSDGLGNVFLWALSEVRDPNGNVMRYRYALVDDPGVDGGSEPGRNLYLQRITYTGRDGADGRYAVSFVRDRDLGETPRVDKTIDARGGFKRVSADLLRRIDVTLDTELVRRYELSYTVGAFHKTLLERIAQFDADGVLFNQHEFSYFDDIRDPAGEYQAFSPAPWTSPDDGLGTSVLNLTPDQAGDASALNANTSLGGGGHLYVGVGTSPSKSGSVGVKAGFNHSEGEGLLALIDVDGDSLPDKVFRDGGTVRYRKNLSGPGGELSFSSEVRSLGLPGIMAENNNSLTLGIEGYAGAVAAQLDHVTTFSTTSQYFSDVNGDGIADLVTGSSVLFGRIGADGVPVYGVSRDTPVPIATGQVDTDGLLADLTEDQERLIDSFPLLDSVRRWVAPFDGTVQIQGAVALSDGTAAARAASPTADGVRVAIQHEDTELWSTLIGPQDDSAHTPVGVSSVPVSRGDRIYFRVQSVFDSGLDQVSWDPEISYLSVPDPLDVNGLPSYRYRASRDFTLGGRDVTVEVPLTGTMHLSGDLTKKATTSDDMTVVITRAGVPVLEQTVAGTGTGTVPVDLDIPVQQGQVLAWRVRADSPIDLDQIEWTPRAFYTEADGVAQLVDSEGQPLIDVFPPYQLDMYPVNDLTAPQGFHAVPADGSVEVAPSLTFDFGIAAPTARVAFTVKRRGELLAKRFFEITGGVVSPPAPFSVPVTAGDDLFFDFSTLDPTLRTFLTSRSVEVDGLTVASAFHSSAEEGAFPQPYRGWAAIGYNGNRDRATQPIVQTDLVVDETFGDQLPDNVDPQAEQGGFGADPRIDPPAVTPFSASPQRQQWTGGENSWVARDSASSARLGGGSITLPQESDFAGSAVPRLSRSEQISLTGTVGGGVGNLGGSIATGDSTGQVDFLDLNGDLFPDVVGAGGIQYTDPDGALGETQGSMPDGAVRRVGNEAGNASAGSAARTIPTGRGQTSPPGHSTANTAEAGNDMPPLGVGGSLGGSESETAFDLLDINGDGLPDRAYSDGQVALNLGYRFGARESWPNAGAVNHGSGSNAGLNIGFNTDFYGFAGGASYSEASSSAQSTLADLNADGLMDRVFTGDPITVSFNTGNGFQPPVPFHGSLPQINRDQNASLGGGAYFTFSICFIVVCIIINPGGDVSTGASRTEQMLRDIDGDGFPDHLLSTSDDQLTVAQNQTNRTNLLASVDRPLGARMEFDYTRDGNTLELPQSRWVLSRVAVHDGQPGDGQDMQLTTYQYQDGAYDRLERQFHGYGTVVGQVRDPGSGDAVHRSVTRDYRNDSYYTRGLVARELTTDPAGNPLTGVEHSYLMLDVHAPGTPADPQSTTATIFPQLVRTDRHFYEGQAVPGKSTFTELEYDPVGNLTRSLDVADAGVEDDVDLRIRYTADDPACQGSHIVGTANAIDVFGGGILMRHRESTVDCATGNVGQVRARLADGQTAVTDLEYSGTGNLESVTGPANQTSQRYRLDYTYDPVLDTHVTSVTDSFGFQSQTTYDLRFGLVDTSTDFNNQQIRNTYDPAGRLDTVAGPYELPEGRITIDFEYHPEGAHPFAVTRHVDREADGSVRADTIDTITFVDGLMRTTQSKRDASIHIGENEPAAAQMVVSGRVSFDFLGRQVQQFYPTTEPKGTANTTFNPAFDPVPPTSLAYDVLDRNTSTVFPDGTSSSIGYGFGPDRDGTTQFETVITDRNGNTKRTYADLRRLNTSIKEFNPAGGQPVIWTSYTYNPLKELTSVIDDHLNVTTASYDNLGRRTVVDSPDSGRTETVYDLAGNPIRKITAKLAETQQAIEYDYDFNRLRAIRYPVFPANNVTYTYGGPGAPHDAANRITDVVDGAGTLAREYGPLGEVTRETRVTPAQGSHIHTFVTEYRYDTWNRMLGITYPDGEVLSYHYDSGGKVDSATGTKGGFTYPYLSRLEYDKFEQRALLDTGNGTRTRYSYNPDDRRLNNIQANLDNGYVFQNLNYSYDDAGNVLSIVNDTVAPSGPEVGMQVGGPSTQTFQYDDLYRLTHAEGSYQPRTPHTDQYRTDLTYDSVHNLVGKSQVHELVSDGNVQTEKKLTYDYDYGYAAAQPHAATTIGIYTLQYDANGNQISREQQPKPRRQMIWDEENRLACSHENVQTHTLPQTPESCDNAGGTPNNARYFYDDQGNRVVKDGAQFHLYPNQNFSTRGNQEYKHVYIGSTKLVSKFVEPDHRFEDRQFYSHGDHLGSTGFVTDDQGGLAEHTQYFAGGETWVSEHPSQPVPQQFTGKELDPETNLYYYGARYYDPRTQLWQTPDPIYESYLDGSPNNGVYAPANLNPYLYTFGNPQGYVDPTGKLAIVDDILFWAIGSLFGARNDSFFKGVGQNFVESWSVILRTAFPFHSGQSLVSHFPAWLLQSTWGLVNELVGTLFGYFAVELFGAKTEMYEHVQLITSSSLSGAFTLGDKVVGNTAHLGTTLPSGVSVKGHEQGHFFQNLLLGPLYVPVIGIPSLIHAAVHTSPPPYEHFYTESWASAWGK